MAKDCEETCMGCEGSEQYVKVDGFGWPTMYFIYCQKAIDSDRERGFNVVVVPKKEYDEYMSQFPTL